MKKLSVLGMLILVAMFCFTAKADIVTLDGANEIANAFFANSASSQKKLMKSTTQLEYAWDSNSLKSQGSSMMKSVEEDPTFYVFNNPDGEGFVIVSGDSNARSVIGYSYEGNIPVAAEIPAPMQDYLLGIDEEIKWARTNLTSGNSNLKTANESIAGTPVTNITTAKWSQGSPFNNLCPIVKVNKYDSDGNLIGQEEQATSAGCIPTAFAIVMRYHQWPLQGIGTIEGSYSYDQYNEIPQDIREETIDHSATTYDWNNMPMTTLSSWTSEQQTQVATLLRNLGYAFGVTYTPGNTYVNDVNYVPANVLNCFGYKVEEVVYGNYNISGTVINDIGEWKGKLKSSLDDNCPIPYAATNSGTGDSRHMFVVDDYTNSDYFHFNFGWGGNGNGWYTLEAVTPSKGDNYSWTEKGAKHRAYLNFQPNRTVTVSVAVDGDGSVTIDGEGVTSKEVEAGTQVTLQATDSNFYGWMVGNDVVSTENPYTFTAKENKTYTAKYTTEDNSVTIYHDYLQQDDQDIKTNCSVSGLKVNDSAYPLGIDLTLTANCNRGYAFKGWYTLDETLSPTKELSTDNPYTFTTSAETFAIYYSFEKLSTITPNVQSSNSDMGAATWSYNGEQGAVYAGDEITLTATPKSGYMFAGWSNGTTTISNEKTCTVTLEEGVTYTANFALAGADYYVNKETGTFGGGENSTSKQTTWVYNTSENYPVPLELKATNINGSELYALSGNKYYACAYDNQANGYTTVKYTLSVPEGFIIKGYEMTYSVGSSHVGKVTIANDDSSTTPSNTSSTILSAKNLETSSTSFTLSVPSLGQQYITVTSFVVSVLSTGGGELPTTQYTVTVNSNPSTAGTASIIGYDGNTATVVAGYELSFTAAPTQGYEFVNWTDASGNEISKNAEFYTAINSDVTYTANFAKPKYTASVAVNPTEGGTATVAVGTGQAAASQTVDAGTTVTFYAAQAEGYEFVNWTNGTSEVSGDNPFSAPINANITLTANFRQTEQGGGEVEVAQLVRTKWTVTASTQEPAEAQWGGGGETRHAIDNSETTFWHSQWDASKPTVPHWIQFNLGGLYEISAINYVSRSSVTNENNGQIKDYRLYISSSDISANINSTTYVPNGLEPVKDDVFTYGTTNHHNVTLDAPVIGQYIYLLVDDSYNVDASGIKFANCAEFYASGKPAYTVSATASPNDGGTASVSANVIGAGESVTFTATTNAGYNFLGWYNGEVRVSENLEYTQAITADLTLTAKYEKQTFTVSATPNGTNGTVTVSPNTSPVKYGTEVTFTATANPGYRFVSWSNDETANPYITTITANTELTATFEAIPTYTVGVTYGAGGTATVSQGTVEENGTVTLTAKANDGYRFTGWSIGAGEIISTANPYTTPAITADVEYVANFAEEGKLLLTFACLSDLHAQQEMISDSNNIYIRESAIKTLEAIKNDKENVDLIVLGGDYTSNNTIPVKSWKKTRELLVNATRRAFDGTKTPVIYVNGNHEYEVANYDAIPKPYNAGDYYDVPMKTDIGALSENTDCFYETAINGTGEAFELLAAYHYVVNGFDFVVLNGGKYLFETASSYAYSEESVAWVSNKLAQIYASDPTKTVFFLVHIPFSDSNRLSDKNKGMDRYSSTTPRFAVNLKNALAKYPNLIMLYGHDHGTDSAYIRSSTEERVTVYATDGSKYSEGAAQGDATYYIQNSTGKYLGYITENLGSIDNPSSDATFTPSTIKDGAFVIKLTNAPNDGNGKPRQYVNCGSNGRFSGNKDNDSDAQQIYLFEVADPTAATITATQATSIVAGKTYMLVGVKDSKYYALTDVYTGTGDTQRMEGAEVTVDNGTITYSGTATILWAINKKPSATDKSFFSSFMGSMRYYENSFENGQIAERRIIQALMVYVYSDRVELKMKNYGEGDVTSNNGQYTVKQNLDPYISYRTVTHSKEQVTATPKITSKGGDVAPDSSVTVTVEAPEWHKLYYTINGEDPTESSDKVDKGQITFTAVEGEYVIKVVAQEGIRQMSPVTSVTYTVIDTHGITVSSTEGGTAEFSIEGDNVTLTASEPAEGYYFVGWSVGESAEIVSVENPYTTTIVPNTAYKANFAKLTYTVTITAGEGGKVNTIQNPVTHGETIELTAIPNEGYQFVNWTVGETVVSTEITYEVTVTEDISLTANFEVIPALSPEEIYADITKPTVTSGNTSTVLAATVFYYQQAVTLQGDVTFAKSQKIVTKPISVVKGTTTFDLDLKIRYNWFGIQLFQIDANNNSEKIYGYYGASSASLSAFVTSLDADVEAGKISYTYETVTEGTENKNNYFVTFPITVPQDLNVGDVFVVRVLTAQNETPVSGSYGQGEYVDFLFVISNQQPVERTVKAKSNDINMGSVQIISPSQGGTGTGTGGTGTGGQTPTVTTAENVTVQAFIQSDDYRFVNWTIGSKVIGTDDTYTYTGSADVTIQANFEKIPEIYTVSVSSNNRAMGSATMSATTPTVEEGTQVTFTATAYEGYEFVGWSVGESEDIVSSDNPYATTITANTALKAVFQEIAGLAGRWYRIKEVSSGYYLNAANYQEHTSGTNGGVNVVALNKNSNDQIFKFVASGTNYTLKTRSGYYIYCQSWNVDALSSKSSALTFVDNGNDTYTIKNGSNYFKVENVSGTIYPFCDAPSNLKATWVLEPVKTSEVSVKKTSDNATIKVTTDQTATIEVGGSTKATNATSATITIGATDGYVGEDIKVESIDGYITSVECVADVELARIPVTVTEITLRNTTADDVIIDSHALSKITVVSDANNNVAKVSTTSNLSQGVQVVVEKEIITPHAIDGKGTPTYFNFLSMPFAFNTSSIEYWDGDSWEPAEPESQIRILMYDSQKRANGDLKNTWRTLKATESVDIAANEGFVIVGNNELGETIKLKFTSAVNAYDGSVETVTASSYRNGSGVTSDNDADWNFNGVPYLTNGLIEDKYTLYFHNGYSYEAVTPSQETKEKVISAYQGVMYQANIESGSIDIYITPSSASRATNASDDVFARAYISVDDAAPAKIILSDESSENFVVNEDAWYLAPTANTEAAAYFNIGGANASVTVQPAASELPMTVYTGAGTQHRITLATTDGNYDVYLKDAVTDEVVCLNNEDYTFTATAKSTIANRFTVSMVEFTGIIDAARAEGTIKVVVAGDVIKLFGTEEGDQVALYTANGMLITNAIAEDGVTNIETSANGVIIIKVADETVKVVK